jgi:uncharacterized caspase-like protein
MGPRLVSASLSSRAIAAAAIFAAAAPAAADDERVALILGNAAYRHTAPLRNSTNDSSALAQAFARLGYRVLLGEDLTRDELGAQTKSFFEQLKGADIAVFFYAGHGLQIDGRNFLMPVDFDPKRAGPLADQLVSLDTFVEGMSRRARQSLVFLDACRNNPLAADLKSSGAGLAEFKGRVRTLIAFATQPGSVAADGDGPNSPFTTALLTNLEEPGLEVRELMTKVRVAVVRQTSGAQVPWDHSSLLANFYVKKRPRRFASPP